MKERSVRFRRIRALCIGGLVFGIGCTATLATWADSERVTATLETSSFGIRGSNNGGTSFVDQTGSNTTLALTLSPATKLSPGAKVYAGYAIQTVENSLAGTVTLTGIPAAPDSGTLLAKMNYGVRVTANATCNETAFNASTGYVVGNASTPAVALNSAAAAAGSLLADRGSTIHYCFMFTLLADAPSTLQGASASATFTFTGTSVS